MINMCFFRWNSWFLTTIKDLLFTNFDLIVFLFVALIKIILYLTLSFIFLIGLIIGSIIVLIISFIIRIIALILYLIIQPIKIIKNYFVERETKKIYQEFDNCFQKLNDLCQKRKEEFLEDNS